MARGEAGKSEAGKTVLARRRGVGRSERLHQMLADTNEVMLRATEAQQLFDAACRIAVDLGGLRMAWVGLVDAEAGRLDPVAAAGTGTDYLASATVSVREDDAESRGPAGVAVRQGRTDVCNDVAGDPRMAPWRSMACTFGFAAAASFPLTLRGRAEAAITVYSGEAGFFDPEALRLLERLAVNISYAWEKLQLQGEQSRSVEALRTSEQRLRTVLSNAPLVLFALDEAGRYLLAEGKALQALGLAPADVVGRPVFEVCAGFPELLDAARHSLAGHAVHQVVPAGRRRLELWATPMGEADRRASGVIGVAVDVTEQATALAALQASETRFRALVHHVSDTIVVLDATGAITYASPAAARSLGYGEGSRLGADLLELVHPDDAERVAAHFQLLLEHRGDGLPVELRLLGADGTWRRVEAVGDNLLDEPGVGGVVVVVRDVTERRRAELALDAQSHILEMIARGSPLGDTLEGLAHGVEAQVEAVSCSVTVAQRGVLRHRAGRRMPGGLVSPAGTVPISSGTTPCAQAAAGGRPVLVGDLADDRRWEHLRAAARPAELRSWWSFPVLHPSSGAVLGTFDLWGPRPGLPDPVARSLAERAAQLAGIAVERERAAAALAHQATHDSLTGLPNRTLLIDRLEMALRRGRRHPEEAPVVVFLDLDRLKVINDSLGHEAGDRLLVEVARRLRAAVRASDTVARFGGDEFVVVVEGPPDPGGPGAVAERILAALSEPVLVEGHRVVPAASAGVVPAAGYTAASDVIRDADVAMYRAKHRGGGAVELFDAGMRARAVDRLDLEHALRRAVDAGELRLQHQPIIDLAERTVVGVEALVRWQHPTRGLLGPAGFIPLAEEAGLIGDVGRWVLRRAVHDVAGRPAVDEPRVLHINVSARQLVDPLLPETVEEAVARLPAGWTLCLELTESTLVHQRDSALQVLEDLRRLGVTLAIDDFGTGYSSLTYLTLLPVSTLKIDRSFVSGLGQRPDADTIAAAVIGLGRQLDLVVVAEGVETEAQVEVLTRLGCTRAQGYLFHRPLDPEAVGELLGPRPG